MGAVRYPRIRGFVYIWNPRDCNTAKAADNLEMLRISLAWPSLRPSDLQDFARVRKVASGYRFNFETI